MSNFQSQGRIDRLEKLIKDNSDNIAKFSHHNNLSDRNLSDAHPISSITDLQTVLDSKADLNDFQTVSTTVQKLNSILEDFCNTGLVIVRQPVDFIGNVGDQGSFTARAIGDGLSYQWQWLNSSSVWTDQNYDSFKKPNLLITMTAGRVGYQYRCKITDAWGTIVYSDPVQLRTS